MSDIPTQSFHQILCRLPTAALPTFRRVCKTWRRTIDDYLRLQIGNNHLIFRNSTGKLHSIPLTSLSFSASQQSIQVEATKVTTIIRLGIPVITKSLPVSSCHGLILLWSFMPEKDWAIWNPLTKECHELPPFDDEPTERMARGGLGYDRVTDDYKVVRVSQIYGRINGLETLIYSLKSDEWRRIADYPNCRVQGHVSDFGVFANGALHWIMWTNVECIMALDLRSERYSQLPMPFIEDEKSFFDSSLECLNECLVLSHSSDEKFDVWMMKESSWMKFFSFKKVYGVNMYIVDPKVIAYIESSKHVLIQNDGELLWFDLVKKKGRMIEVDGNWDIRSYQAFPVCRVRLPGNEGVVESTLKKRKRKSSKEKLRLRLKSVVVCFSPEPK